MDLSPYDYPLPPALIAQFPAAERTASRLLTVPANGAPPGEIRFGEIGALLNPGDVLVANDTRVLPARLRTRKPTGGKVEILLERILDDNAALVQVRANKPVRAGQTLLAGPPERERALLVTERRDGFAVIQCRAGGGDRDGDRDHDHERDQGSSRAAALFQQHGTLPLPPYIARAVAGEDSARYQTVYSRVDGAVAAPTAGLHFDRALIAALASAGIHWATITLHIGAGTFQPLRAESLAAGRMHREWVEVGRQACEQIARAQSRGGRVVAVGTTVVRALESAAHAGAGADTGAGALAPFAGDTELFIRPGHRFRAVDALITNFHLPRSTLLLLVCAFAGREKILRAYRHAIARNFRFYSYGDAMFVERAR